MDIIELGAIGELVGGVAVIGSLIYVGLQLKQNADQAKRSNEIERAHAEREVSRDFNEIILSMCDSAFMKAYRQATIDFGGLPANDRAKLHMYLTALVVHATSAFLVDRRHLMDEHYADRWLQGVASLASSPGIGSWWSQTKVFYHQGFVARIDELLENAKGHPPINVVFPWMAPDGMAEEA